MKNDCIFCAIAAGEIPARKIWEDDFALAFLDINPMAPGHVLVIPKEHAADMAEADPEMLGELVKRVRGVAVRVAEKLGAAGWNVLQNNGAAAGQTVRHIHFHVIPRTEGAEVSFAPGCMGAEELDALAAKLAIKEL